MAMTIPSVEALEFAEESRNRLAGQGLSPAMAKLYSQHTLLRSNQPGLFSWTSQEAEQRLDDAIRLIDAGFTLLAAEKPTYRECVRRAGELLEWLSHPAIGLPPSPLHLVSAATYQLAGYPARAFAILNSAAPAGGYSEILRSFFRCEHYAVLKDVANFWSMTDPALQTELNGSQQTDIQRLRTTIIGDTIGAIGIIAAASRWGSDSRLAAAIDKLRAVASVLVREKDRYSWLLAKLTSQVAWEFSKHSLRTLLADLQPRLSSQGQAALERYLRIAHLNSRTLAWPSQEAGIQRLLQEGSFALCTPTGSGKTAVAEIAILQALFEPERTSDDLVSKPLSPIAVYLVPSRALAAEVEAKLTRVFRRLTDRRVIVTGLYGGTDWGPTDAWLTADDPTVLICTYEKGEALMRFLGTLFLDRVSLVVIDEAHSVQFSGSRQDLRTGNSRALYLESLGMRLFSLLQGGQARVIALSAVATGIEEALQSWVTRIRGGTPVRAEYRSTRQLIGRLLLSANHTFEIHYDLLDRVPLQFGTLASTDTPYVRAPFPPCPAAPGWDGEGPEKRLRPAVLWAAMHMAAPDEAGIRHGVLVSLTETPEYYAEDFLRLLERSWVSQTLPEFFTEPLAGPERELLDRCRSACADYFGQDSPEYRLLGKGIVLHHGKMPTLLGRLMVALVQEGVASLVLATSTLSEGVNLPLETILIPSLRRKNSRMSAGEFANLAGRAGRPRVATEGRTLVLLERPQARSRQQWSWYSQLLSELSATEPAVPHINPSHSSALAELLSDIWEQWQSLTGSTDRSAFITWLEMTAPISVGSDQQANQHIPEVIQALDTLDSILLPAVVELELARNATATEQQMQILWGQSFAAVTAAPADLRENFIHRGAALSSTVYTDRIQRRQLYRTGLPPRSGNQLLGVFTRLREVMRSGVEYAIWPRDRRFDYVANVVGIIGEIDRFRYSNRINRRQVAWRDILAWWFDPINRPHDPGPRRRAEWFKYVSQQFIYRFAWGLGSFIGLATDESRGEGFSPTRLEDWPQTRLPWIVFWLKELVTWGTLDPVAAFLLSRAQANTRGAAEAMAGDYYRQFPMTPEFDPLEPSSIRAWAEAVISPIPEARAPRPDRSLPATLIEDFTGQTTTRWRVLPVEHEEGLLWVDPAGYRLAISPRPQDWLPEFLNRYDFFLDTDKLLVRSEPYL